MTTSQAIGLVYNIGVLIHFAALPSLTRARRKAAFNREERTERPVDYLADIFVLATAWPITVLVATYALVTSRSTS